MPASIPFMKFGVSPVRRGVTLMEMTIVLMLIIALLGIGVYFGFGFGDWMRGKKASEELKSVYTAQRVWLAENPLKKPADIKESDIIPLLHGKTALPVVTGNKDEALTINFTVSPPVFLSGEETYDPSPASDDGVWDVGSK